VVAFHYRGYPPSTGEPSADALIADAPLVFDHAVERVKPSRIIAVGFSIGSGVAATLAAQRDLDGLILVTPFDSLKAVAQALYPWVPIGPFFAHEIDAAGALADADLPVAILAAERDEIVPPERTKALRACVTKLVFDRTMAHAGHNDIYARSDFHQAMREAMAVLIRSG
jgi:dienelactone hydrolase